MPNIGRDDKGRFIEGHEASEEMKMRISEAVKKHLVDHPEIRDKISLAHIGKLTGDSNPSKRPEVRAKISEAKKGTVCSLESRKRVGESLKKYFAVYPEAKQKLSEKLKGRVSWNKGKSMSEEVKQKLRIAQKRQTSCLKRTKRRN